MKSKSDIIKLIRKEIKSVPDILFAYLHGSFCSGDIYNDIDISIYIDESLLKKISILDYEIDLSLELERKTKFPIDVKILNSAPLPFKFQATNGLLLFAKQNLKREEFLCKTWGAYFDFLPISKKYFKEVLSV